MKYGTGTSSGAKFTAIVLLTMVHVMGDGYGCQKIVQRRSSPLVSRTDFQLGQHSGKVTFQCHQLKTELCECIFLEKIPFGSKN